jgi:hypothetical protein
MERHTIMIHNLIYINKNINNNNTKDNVKFVHNNVSNVLKDASNVREDASNVREDASNVAEYKCSKCDKVLSQKRTLIKHEEKCKGVKNSLECHKCHKVFTARSTKCEHVKKCSPDALTLYNKENDTINNINNGTIINNNTINNTINNTNNITVISFGDGKDIQFMNDHITAKMLTQMYSDGNTVDGLRQYMQKLLEIPENRLIKKTNAKQAFSKVHCGNGNWETRLDQDIYPKLVNQMANDNWDKIRYYNESNAIKLRETLTKRLLDNLEVLTSWDKPDDYEDEQKRTFKQTISMLKLLVLDISKL